ncbi:type 2 lanthipeptide synthetase LanM [Streptomyces xanthophaeus]|uniref:type 2 lanthipeptide synthetase LanM n=1 Tax=Streptomyces xanthophaeus TaxID=67385 RepID=UPI00371D41E8
MYLSDASLEELVKRITEERADVFGAFYTPYLRDCTQHIARFAQDAAAQDAAAEGGAAPHHAVDIEAVAESVLRSLMGRCIETGVRTLIAAFHAEGGGYEAFHARVAGEQGRGEVLARFPELDRLLKLVTARAARTATEVLSAAAADRPELTRLLGMRGRIDSVTPGLGDSHRGGRTVCLVTWDDGTRAVYKPQQDNCQQLLSTLHAMLDADGEFFGPLHPRSIVRPTHVWQEFIERTDLDDTAAGDAYFRRFGRAAALLSMIGATDLHHENIIAVPGGPVVIDTETLVSLPNGIPENGASAQVSLNLDVEHSVLNTLLFPARYAGAKLDVDISGIGCVQAGTSEQLQSYMIVDAGTDDIRFDRSPVVVEHGSNMATVAGEPLDPRNWVDDITAGYSEARALLETHREAIEAAVRDSHDWAVRQVVRPTYVYARFLEASTHPVHLESSAARAELLGNLPKQYRGAAADSADAVHREEVAALLDLDVPFFTVDCDSGLLRGNGASGAEEMRTTSGTTPRQSALAAVRSFFARPPERDLTYVRYALAGSADDVWDVRRTSHRTAFPDLADAGAFHRSLRDLVVGEASAPTWLLPRLQGDGLRLGGVNAPLYDGGGLLLHLAQVEALTGVSPLGVDMEAASRAAMHPVIAPDGTPLSMSPFTGILSDLVTDWEIRRIRTPGAPFIAGPAPRPVPQPLDVDALTAADFDYLNGYGGHLVHLAAHLEHGAPELTGVAPELLLRRLIAVDGDPESHSGELGLSHGRFGRIAAMSAMVAKGLDGGSGARGHLERFADAYLRQRWQDDSLRDRASGSGWCKGYAGVALAAGELLTALGEPASAIRGALAPEVERVVGGDLGEDISFCHGAAGRIAVLCTLADRFAWPELRDEAAALHTAFLDRHADGGWTCGIGTEPHLPSFFLGLSGWHHARLMLDHPGATLPVSLGGR